MASVRVTMPVPSVTLVRLNRPEKRNALSVALLVEMADAFNDAARDNNVRCVILAGDDQAFSAGADIAELRQRGPEMLADPVRIASWSAIERFPKPLIAAVDGVALGGGNELAMLADIVVAGAGARFGQPEVSIGGTPGDGGTQRLVRAVGKSMAMQMILAGEPIDADTALRCGLVSEVTPPGEAVARALSIAESIASGSPSAAVLAKAAILHAFESTLASGLAFERQISRINSMSADRKKGLEAFLHRRQDHDEH